MATSRRAASAANDGHPGRTVGRWVVAVIVGAAVAGILLPAALSKDIRLTNRAESQRAAQLMAQRLQPPSDTELFVVTSSSVTVDDPGFRAVVERLQARLQALGPRVVVAAVSFYQTKEPSFVSKDRRATIVPTVLAGKVGDAPKKIPALRRAAGQIDAGGYRVYLAGDASVAEEVTRITQSDLEKSGTVGFVVALVLLAVAMGSLAALGMPLVVTIATSAVALALMALVGQLAPFMALSALAVFVVGLAVAMVQSSSVVARYRQERAGGLSPAAAARVAGSTAGRVALYGGAAVCLGLTPVLLVPVNVAASVAGAMIFVVAAATLAAVTLVPALLRLFGDRVDRLPIQLVPPPADRTNRVVGGIGRSVVAVPVIYLVVGLAVTAAGTSQWSKLRVGTPSPATLPASTAAAHAIGVLAVNFPTLVKPVEVVVDGASTDAAVSAGVRTLTDRLGQDQLFGPATVTNGKVTNGTVTNGTVTNGKGIVVVSAPLFADPTSQVALDAVGRVRADYVPAAFKGVPVYVGGASAGFKDQTDAANRWFPVVIGLALVVAFVVLAVALRSLVLPLVAVVFNLLATGTALGLSALVFQHGFGSSVLGFPVGEHVFTWIPLLVYCSLFAISTSSFLYVPARIQERHAAGARTNDAVVSAMGSAAGPPLGATLVLLPVLVGIALARNVIFQQGAFATAVGLLADAVILRLFVLPAVVALSGRSAGFLPGWSDSLPGGVVAGGVVAGGGSSRSRTDWS